ncbi:unnamed protein product [Mucor hiemalis]
MSKNIPSVKLNSGYDFPLIGYGTFGGNDAPEQVYNAAKAALEAGYKHFDTAYVYQTEEALGKAVKESGVPREELFITTKLHQFFHKPEHVRPVFDHSLKLLQMDYVESTKNMHVTNVPVIDTWREMEKLVKDKKARSIGVSNFTIPMLEDLLSKCSIPPAVLQVEIHPALPQEELVAYCKSKNIILTAYSPLGNPGYRKGVLKTLEEPVVLDIAKKYNKTPVQVLLNWGVNRGYAVIPKSVTPSRIEANLTYFKMDDDDIEAITALGREHPHRTCKPEASWGPEHDIFA